MPGSTVRRTCLLTALAAWLAAAGAPHSGPAPPAAGASDALEVYPGHPRLIVGGYRGVSIEALRATCAAAELRGQCDGIGGRHVLDDAMRYLLADDAAAAGRAASALRAMPSCGDGYEATPAGGYALAYDWVWPALSPADRAQIEARLVSCGRTIAGDGGLRGNAPHLWHGFTSQAAALALIALAVDDEAARAPLLADATELFRATALEAYRVVGGAWPEGYNYERSHFFSGDPPYQYVMDALRAWDTAVARDHPDHESIFDTIAQEEGDWLRGLGYHLHYGTLDPYRPAGKRTLLRGGDMPTGQAYPNKQVRPFVDAIARVYLDGNLAGWGRALEDDWSFVGGTGTYHSIHRYGLPLNLPLWETGPRPVLPPLGRIWGRADLGYVITRSGWTDGETTVGYRAGKWFTGHQHMDQGHLDIWRKGPLAVDAGVYARWGSEHREAYYMRTVAHNTLLVHRPGEGFAKHPGTADVNDDGQRVHTYGPGCAQCMQSVAEWREHVGAGMHFEAATVDAFEDGPGYTVVHSDLTGAYNSTRYTTPGNAPKVEWVQRDLVFARPAALLVLDRVRTTPGSGPPRFVLHLPDRPEVPDLALVEGTADNGILAADGATFAVENGSGGALHGVALSPNAVRITAIGGPDYRYWVDGRNRTAGAGGLEGPPAEPGSWRIEVAPADPALDTLLVHALSITDAGSAPVGSHLLEAATDPAAPAPVLAVAVPSVGAPNNPWRIVVASATVPRSSVAFLTVPSPIAGPLELLLTDLVPGAEYRLATDGMPAGAGRASPEGVLAIHGPPAGRFEIGRCPAPEGAGATWRALCAGAPTPPGPTATSTPTVTPPGPTGEPPADRLYMPAAGR